MQIRRLVLENFGLFRGRNEIELTPRPRQGRKRPVVLIGGKNGSGKTTLLEAVRLCLYGPLALGIRGGGRKYEEYLGECIHRADNSLFQPRSAAVGMEFEYAQAGERHSYSVERSWDRLDHGVPSKLVVLRDGKPLDELDQAHADDFLRDLVPPGVSQLFFFDGEKIQQLAETEQDHLALGDAIRGLLGLEIIDRLRGDLRIYTGRLRQVPQADPLHAELARLAEERTAFETRRRDLVHELDESRSRLDRIRQDVAREEQRLTRAGGGFASKRESLQAEKSQLEQMVKGAEGEIRELCESLLPFTLASSLCQRLREQLEGEGRVQNWQTHETLIQARLDGMKKTIGQALFPDKESGDLDAKARRVLTGRVTSWLEQLLQRPADLPDVPLIHRLSDEDRARLLAGIDRVQNELPRHLRHSQKRLERHVRRLREVERSLEKIPSDDVLKPLLERIRDLHRELAAAQAEVERNELGLKGIDLHTEELDRSERKLREKLQAAEQLQGRIALAAKVQTALEDYAQGLTVAKIGELREGVTRCFTQLWRKGDLVRRIEIDPKDFTVTLFDRTDRVVPKKQLSAGEKQIYAISLLWALGQASGRPLPMVIDTPLGRLDSEHRRHLVERYFPNASHQVVIFSTDTEIDRTYFRDLGPSISHAYQLRYDQAEARCVVEKGYFWEADQEEVGHAG